MQIFHKIRKFSLTVTIASIRFTIYIQRQKKKQWKVQFLLGFLHLSLTILESLEVWYEDLWWWLLYAAYIRMYADRMLTHLSIHRYNKCLVCALRNHRYVLLLFFSFFFLQLYASLTFCRGVLEIDGGREDFSLSPVGSRDSESWARPRITYYLYENGESVSIGVYRCTYMFLRDARNTMYTLYPPAEYCEWSLERRNKNKWKKNGKKETNHSPRCE